MDFTASLNLTPAMLIQDSLASLCPQCSSRVSIFSINADRNLKCSKCSFQFPFQEEKRLSNSLHLDKNLIPEIANIQISETSENFQLVREQARDFFFFLMPVFPIGFVALLLWAGSKYVMPAARASRDMKFFAVSLVVRNTQLHKLRSLERAFVYIF